MKRDLTTRLGNMRILVEHGDSFTLSAIRLSNAFNRLIWKIERKLFIPILKWASGGFK